MFLESMEKLLKLAILQRYTLFIHLCVCLLALITLSIVLFTVYKDACHGVLFCPPMFSSFEFYAISYASVFTSECRSAANCSNQPNFLTFALILNDQLSLGFSS